MLTYLGDPVEIVGVDQLKPAWQAPHDERWVPARHGDGRVFWHWRDQLVAA